MVSMNGQVHTIYPYFTPLNLHVFIRRHFYPTTFAFIRQHLHLHYLYEYSAFIRTVSAGNILQYT